MLALSIGGQPGSHGNGLSFGACFKVAKSKALLDRPPLLTCIQAGSLVLLGSLV